ncbi:addiction module toxin RelE [Citrobacter murliniae]|uniref:Addiction module toxin RelE n=1 Tax=Citrobacter murliniae TaxID=67829 RepID=A0ABY2PVW4_9ENTR|nr:addiction module toxin RelE [Citrobacter murliniae]
MATRWYTKLFKLHQGGKTENPQALSSVSSWGEKTQLEG